MLLMVKLKHYLLNYLLQSKRYCRYLSRVSASKKGQEEGSTILHLVSRDYPG